MKLTKLHLKQNEVLSVSFVGPRVIAQINRNFVGHEGITDVISFDYRSDDPGDTDEVAVEVLICIDVAYSEGEKRPDSSYADELVLYLVHGLLHAAGEDDLDEKSRKRMRKREREVIQELKQEFTFSEIFPL